MQPWYLSYMIVHDIQTGEKFRFFADKWLAIDRDEFSSETQLPVSMVEDNNQESEEEHKTHRYGKSLVSQPSLVLRDCKLFLFSILCTEYHQEQLLQDHH